MIHILLYRKYVCNIVTYANHAMILVGIAPRRLRHEVAYSTEREKQKCDPRYSLCDYKMAPVRIK